MMRLLAAAVCLALALFGGLAHFSSAAFTASTAIPSNALQVDQLANRFSVTPGSAVQVGTSTPIASGNVDSLSLSFGTVPSARTFANVFTITNVSASPQTATLSLSSVSQISSVAFASSGSTTATLGPGASTTLSVTTSSTIAGHGSGTLKLGVSGLSWMYRTYTVSIDEAPEASGAPTATQKPAGRLDLAWSASSTTTNLAGYNVYRSSGGAYTKLNATPLTTLSYSDTATVDGTSYTYKIRAVSSATPALESIDSSTAAAVADATAPGKPSSVTLTNGGGSGGGYINRGNVSSIAVSVSLAAGWQATDTVTLTVANGGSTVTKTANPSSGTVTFSNIDVSGLADGTVTMSVNSMDAAGNVSATQSSSAPKDTAAPAAPTASYVDNSGTAADQITGTAEANASISITGTSSASGSANGSGAFTINVAAKNGSGGHPVNVSYSVTATDAAGNTSGATAVNAADTR